MRDNRVSRSEKERFFSELYLHYGKKSYTNLKEIVKLISRDRGFVKFVGGICLIIGTSQF